MKKLRKVFGIISSMAFIVLGLVFGFSSLVREQVSAFNQGGAMYFAAGNHVFVGTITGKTLNGSNVYGCGIYSAGNLTISGGHIYGCMTYGEQNNSTSSAYGGGIYSSSTCEIQNHTAIESNGLFSSTLAYGGGVYSNGNLTMDGSDIYIRENAIGPNISAANSFDARGGGIYIAGGECIITSARISDNLAYKGKGAGIYVASGAKAVLMRAAITGNFCFDDGGSGRIDTSVASGAGGGVYVENGAELYVGEVGIVDNIAAVGSAIYNEGLLSLIDPSEISGEIYTTQPIILGPSWIDQSNDMVQAQNFLTINFNGGSGSPIAYIGMVDPDNVDNPFPNEDEAYQYLKERFNSSLIQLTNAPDAEFDFEYGTKSIEGHQLEGWWLVASGGASGITIQIQDQSSGYLYSNNRGLDMGDRITFDPTGSSVVSVNGDRVEVKCILQDQSGGNIRFSDSFSARGADPNEQGKAYKFSHWLYNGQRVEGYTEFSGGGTLTAVFEKVDAVKVNFKFNYGMAMSTENLESLVELPTIFEQAYGTNLIFYITASSSLHGYFNKFLYAATNPNYYEDAVGRIVIDGYDFLFKFYYDLKFAIASRRYSDYDLQYLDEDLMAQYFAQCFYWKKECKMVGGETSLELIPCIDDNDAFNYLDYGSLYDQGIYEVNYEFMFAPYIDYWIKDNRYPLTLTSNYFDDYIDFISPILDQYYQRYKEVIQYYFGTLIDGGNSLGYPLQVLVEDGYEFNDIEKLLMAVMTHKQMEDRFPEWFYSELIYKNYNEFVAAGLADYEELVRQGNLVLANFSEVSNINGYNIIEYFLRFGNNAIDGQYYALLFSNELAFYGTWIDGLNASTDLLDSFLDIYSGRYAEFRDYFFSMVKNFVIDESSYSDVYIQSTVDAPKIDIGDFSAFSNRGLIYAFTTKTMLGKYRNSIANSIYDFIIDEGLQVIDDTGKNRTEIINDFKTQVAAFCDQYGAGLESIFFVSDDVRIMAMLNNDFWHNADGADITTYTNYLNYTYNAGYDSELYGSSPRMNYRFFLVKLVDNFGGSVYNSFTIAYTIMTKLNYFNVFEKRNNKIELWTRMLRSDIVSNCIFDVTRGFY